MNAEQVLSIVYSCAADLKKNGHTIWNGKEPSMGPLMCRMLLRVPPLYVSADIAEALMHASRSLPSFSLQHDDAIGFEGAAVLDGVWPLLPMNPDWARQNGFEPEIIPIDVLSWFHYTVESGADTCGFIFYVFAAFSNGSHAPAAVVLWPCGDDRPRTARMMNQVAEDAPLATAISWLRALWMFAKQEIVLDTRLPVGRGERRRAERDGRPEPSIRVIHLRRAMARATHGDSTSREWHYSWLVSGHWRQQWYPSRDTHAPRWIATHAKGPADKPLKPPRKTVFAVVR